MGPPTSSGGLANEIGADLLLSLHIDAAPSPKPNGIATYHYGAGESSSTIGERLADLAQRELVARTRMLDAHVHGKTWTLLRMTRMPAVRVEVGFLSSPADRSRLVDPTFRDTVAEGLLVAVAAVLAKADDPPTGALSPAVASDPPPIRRTKGQLGGLPEVGAANTMSLGMVANRLDRRIASPGRRLLIHGQSAVSADGRSGSFSVPADVRPADARRTGHADSAHLCHHNCCEDATPVGAHRPGRCAARS
jgi:hypothetical protein